VAAAAAGLWIPLAGTVRTYRARIGYRGGAGPHGGAEKLI
jgi:hypothetical protein